MKSDTVIERLKALGYSVAELARKLEYNHPTLWRKLAGERPLNREEIDGILAFLRQDHPEITYEQLFGEPTEDAPAPDSESAVA